MSLKRKPRGSAGTSLNVQSWVDLRYLAVIMKDMHREGAPISQVIREIIEERAMLAMSRGVSPILSLDEAHKIISPEDQTISNNNIKMEEEAKSFKKEEEITKVLTDTFHQLHESQKEMRKSREEIESNYDNEVIEEEPVIKITEKEQSLRARLLDIKETIKEMQKGPQSAKTARRIESLISEQMSIAKQLNMIG